MIPIEIEDIDKIEKEKVKSIDYVSVVDAEDIPTYFKCYEDADGKCLKREQITTEEWEFVTAGLPV